MSLTVKLAISAVVVILLTTGFFGLDSLLSGTKTRDVSTRLDDRIPFRPAWIWAYLLYYPLCAAPLLFAGVLTDDRLFLTILAGLLAQFFVAWPIFYFYPTKMERPEVRGTSPSARAVRGLFKVDAGYNIFPSLHVANSVYVACVSIGLIPLPVTFLLFAVAGLISVSTMLIKQHYFLDVPAGFMLGAASYLLFF